LRDPNPNLKVTLEWNRAVLGLHTAVVHSAWLTWLHAVAMSRRHASAAHSRTPSIVFIHRYGKPVIAHS